MRRPVIPEAGLPEVGWNHVLDRGDPKVFRDQRVRIDAVSQFDGEPGHPHGELVTFELHLATRDVERSEELQIGRCRRVGEEGLLERSLDFGKILIPNEDHRALSKRRHRLVGRVRLVNPNPHLIWVGY